MSVRLIDAWRNRPPRERWLIGLPAVALLAVALHVGVVEPLRAASARMRTSLPVLEARRDAVQAQAAELRSGPAAGAPRALNLPAIQAALARHQIVGGATVEAAGENRARLAIARAPFFALWPLLQTLQTEQGLRVVSLRVDRLDAGHARAEATLAAGER